MLPASLILRNRVPRNAAVHLYLCVAAVLVFPPCLLGAADASSSNSSRASAATSYVTSLKGTPQQRIAQQKKIQSGAIEGIVRDAAGKPVTGATVTLRDLSTGEPCKKCSVVANADGVFRFIDVPAARYELKVTQEGFEIYTDPAIQLAPGQVLDREIQLTATSGPAPVTPQRVPQMPEVNQPGAQPSQPPPQNQAPYPGVIQRNREEAPAEPPPPGPLPPADKVFQPQPDRWVIAMPDWDRYGVGAERPYVHSRTFDPFDRNKLKGDYPVIGNQTFFNLTATSDTFFDGRKLPTPSDVSAAQPGSSGFFGHGQQAFVDQIFLFSFDLFHGDTAFKPIDWQIRVTPVISLNYLDVKELGIVNINVGHGDTRLDSHIGLQEAFAEVKLADLSPNYDFVSLRAGIQEFNSDFRGFIFVEEQPGLRLFGNLQSNKLQYNVAYFNFLEKNTNSGLNQMNLRKQQVIIGNVYRQDFFSPGYTAQFSVHYNKDDGSLHFDDNGFLVRPAPIGSVVSEQSVRTHSIHAVYLGWTGDGHIGRLNLTHAFYQALGNDSFNSLAGKPVTINAQFAAAELSYDKDWARFKVSALYSSGSAKPTSSRARGFDSIEDFPEFAGGIFSLWNREGIRLTGTGVTLTPPNSIIPDLRSSKDEGQANFVNPGIFLINAGTNLDLTPKLRAFVNLNYLQFMRTEPLELLLFEHDIHRSIGYDYSVGFRYRPPLSENIVFTFGASGLTPGQGLRDIYGGQNFFSLFTDLRFTF
jgi:Carboxypeptidase regulatory-like domain